MACKWHLTVCICRRSLSSRSSSCFPGNMRAGLTIDHGYELSLRSVIDFILAIESALLLLSQGKRRSWQIDANLSAWED